MSLRMTGDWILHLRLASLLAFGLLAGTALAAPLRDAATGLAINPPPGYVATAVVPTGRNAARFSVQRPNDHELGCQLAFAPAPQNARLSQTEINALISQPDWQQSARATLEVVYDITSAGTADYGPIRAMVMQGDIKPRRELPPRSQQIRSYFTIMETPRGRTTLVCVAEKADFNALQPEFEMMARGVTAP
jgi:hypothetical protein